MMSPYAIHMMGQRHAMTFWIKTNPHQYILSMPHRHGRGSLEHVLPLHWRHNDHDGVSNHQPHGCLLNRLFGRRSKKTSKFRVTGLCEATEHAGLNVPPLSRLTYDLYCTRFFTFLLNNACVSWDDFALLMHLVICRHVYFSTQGTVLQ